MNLLYGCNKKTANEKNNNINKKKAYLRYLERGEKHVYER